jgi:hypothetical protein
MGACQILLPALAALGLATVAAAPAGRADVTDGTGVSASAGEESSASATSLAADTEARPWWGSAPDVTPKPWLRGTGEEPWRFVAAGYLWFPNAPATITIGHGDTTLPESTGTIYDSLQFGMMLDLEARKGRFGGYFAPIFVWLRDANNTVDGPDESHQLVVSESVYLMDFGMSYEIGQWRLWNRPGWVVAGPAVTVEPFFGARAMVDDLTITLTPPGRSFTPEISFITPVIGLRTFWDITDRFNLRIEGDYGGFGGVDKVQTTYNVLALVGYRFKPRQNLGINVYAGYRYLFIDYKSVAQINVAIKGAFLGVAFEFGHK